MRIENRLWIPGSSTGDVVLDEKVLGKDVRRWSVGVFGVVFQLQSVEMSRAKMIFIGEGLLHPTQRLKTEEEINEVDREDQRENAHRHRNTSCHHDDFFASNLSTKVNIRIVGRLFFANKKKKTPEKRERRKWQSLKGTSLQLQGMRTKENLRSTAVDRVKVRPDRLTDLKMIAI